MKKIFLFCLIVGISYSCNNDDNFVNESESKLIGNWKLIEILADPGGGSSAFNAVQSDKIITFEKDGTIASNGSLCDMSIDTDNATSGTYSITYMTFNSSDCSNPDYDFTFNRSENILIINYPCIEPCRAKYEKQ
ncbi:hypothetical protein [Cyclobacterium plantarum]|uniref:hypothetical protein n=1 Tax=Cyclobacterium plantarum TaxID=2716263 RepID=UPI003F722F56